MPAYMVNGINIAAFNLGEADKVLTLFTQEQGLIKAVAKSSRKPGSKMAGRADVLNVNKLLLAHGSTFEIITQAETIETFPRLRSDLERLSYSLYYAELTQYFGQGLSEDSALYFDYLCHAIRMQEQSKADAAWLCLEFELILLDVLGLKPEFTYCVNCRSVLTEYNVTYFSSEQGGITCDSCSHVTNSMRVGETSNTFGARHAVSHITPLVWKNLVLANKSADVWLDPDEEVKAAPAAKPSIDAAQRLMQTYMEYRAGKKMKSLDFLKQIKS